MVSLLSGSIQKLDGWAAQLETRIEHHPRWYLFLFSFFFFGTTIPIAIVREMWLDEFITLYTVRFRDLSHLWATLKTGVDLNPPLYHLIVRTSEKLLGESALALRLPSLIGYWVMSLSLFFLVRRRTNALYGVAAALLPFLTVTYEYSFEARPYAIVLGCCPLALLCWQAVIDGRRRKLALAGLALTLAAANCNHYYAILLAFPLAIGELVRTIQRRKIDWAVWCTFAFGVVPVLVFLPLVKSGMVPHKSAYDHIWNKPEVSFLWETYWAILGAAVFPVVAVLGWFAVRSCSEFQRAGDEKYSVPAPEIAAGLSLCALPLLAYGLAVSYVGMITWRYVLPTAAGIAIIVAFGCYRASRGRLSAALALVVITLAWATVHVGLAARRQVEERERFAARDSEGIVRSLGLPVVVQDGLLALPMNYYASPDVRVRMLFPVDLDDVRRYEAADTPERIMAIGKGTFAMPIEDFSQFRREHKEYLVYGIHAGWLISAVLHDGGSVRMVHLGKWQILFLVNEKARDANPAEPVVALHSPARQRNSQPATVTRARLENHP